MMQQQLQMKEEIRKQMKEEMEEEMKEKTKNDDNSFINTIKEFIYENKEALIVSVLTLLFNIDSIHEGMKIKSLPMFYDIETEASTFLFSLFKTLIVTSLFIVIFYLSK